MRWLLDVPFAHRGLHDDDVPENSVAAFEAAVRAGYGIELDVHPSRDGEAVVFHDLDLERLTGLPGRVTSLPVAELMRRNLLGTQERIPLLGEVLQAVDGRVPVMIEIKNQSGRAGGVERRVAELLATYRGPVTVASFNPRTVGWFARHTPGILRGQTAMRLDDPKVPRMVRGALQQLRFNPVTRPHYVSYELGSLPTPWTDAWRERGRALVTWTVRDESDLARAREHADNHVFEVIRPPLSD